MQQNIHWITEVVTASNIYPIRLEKTLNVMYWLVELKEEGFLFSDVTA